jgi:hypothetical protein
VNFSFDPRGSVAFALALAVGSASVPSFAHAAEDAAPPLPAYVELEVSDSVMEPELVRTWASEAVGDGLGDAKVDEAANGRVLAVTIAGVPLAYDVTIGVKENGEWIGDMRTGKCKCDDTQLVARVRGDVAAVAGRLEPGEAPPVTPPIGPETAPKDDREKVPLGGKGKAGIALLVVGVGGVVAGAVLLGMGAKEDAGSDDPSQLEGQDNKPVGGAVLGVGGALVIVGAVLLGLDRRDAKRKRSVAFTPAVGRGGFGLALSGRF